jgi:hypothetical protein
MAPIDDPLSAVVSVQAALTQGGVDLKTTSRFVAAVDALCGSTVDLLGAPIDGLRRRIRARDDAKERLIVEEGEQDLEDARQRRAAARVRRELGEKQAAREAVALEAANQLLNLPPPSNSGGQAEDDKLRPDWLWRFSEYAEISSAEDLQAFWGRVLAGEVRNPGTFSKSTLRILSEIDKGTAEAFERLAARRLPSGWIVNGHDRQFKIDSVTLLDAGLTQAGLGAGFNKGNDDKLYWHEGEWLLVAEADFIPPILDATNLTRAGRELSFIHPLPPPAELLKELGRDVLNNLKSLKLARGRSTPGGFESDEVEDLK